MDATFYLSIGLIVFGMVLLFRSGKVAKNISGQVVQAHVIAGPVTLSQTQAPQVAVGSEPNSRLNFWIGLFGALFSLAGFWVGVVSLVLGVVGLVIALPKG